MLELSGMNYWAIGIVWLLYVMIGAFWYSPAGFAKQWMKHTGVDMMKLPKKDANNAILSVAVSAAVQVITLAIIFNSLQVNTVSNGLIMGILLWLGFTTATTVGVTLYSQRSWKFLWLNSSYFLIVMSIGSVILATWK